MSLNYDFELTFITAYDVNVITSSNIPDKDEPFQNLVQETLNSIQNFLNLYPGVNKMSSFIEYNNRKYKITLQRN